MAREAKKRMLENARRPTGNVVLGRNSPLVLHTKLNYKKKYNSLAEQVFDMFNTFIHHVNYKVQCIARKKQSKNKANRNIHV